MTAVTRTGRRRRRGFALVIAGGAACVGALAIPSLANAHVAAGSISCTQATIDYTKFSSGPQVVQWQVAIDAAVVQSGTYRFDGPGSTLTVPISVTDTNQHVFSLRTGWGSTPMHEIAQATLTCNTPVPPLPAPAPVPTTPAPVTTPPTPAAPVEAPVTTPPPAPAPAGLAAPAPTARPRTPPKVACPRPDMRLALVGPRTLIAGQQATYTVRLHNVGRNPAVSVRVRAVLPGGLSPLGRSLTGAISRGALWFRMHTLAPGGNATMTIRARVNNAAAGDRRFRVQAVERCSEWAAVVSPIRILRVAPAVQPGVTG